MGLFRKASPATGLDREQIAAAFLRGEGLEIGALHLPLRLPPGARARYVDRMSVADLRRQYPELANKPLVTPDIIDNGETLATVADGSADFVVANHFLEHCEDPIRTLQNLTRVLRPGGILFCAVPDKRTCFDRDRATTTLDHLLRDHREGPEGSRRDHYIEWARDVDKLVEPYFSAQVNGYMEMRYSIHFHNWTPEAFLEFLVHVLREQLVPAELVHFTSRPEEMIALLRRR